jgi:hypothetical protein
MNFIFLTVLMGLNLVAGLFSVDTAKSKMVITGTSTVHDWESVVTKFSVTGNWNESTVTVLKASATVLSIESGKSIMDRKTFDALQSEKFPEITLTADRLNVAGQKVTGMASLKIAGVSRQVTISSNILSNTATQVKLKGEIPIKMSDYGIAPPTAMFGSLKTGDDVVVRYEFTLNK